MKTFTKKSGFTLVEIMVSVSIFVVVAMIATGALITASDINRKAQAIKLAVDNVNFALNKMAFEMKLGGIYFCGAGNYPAYDGVGNNCTSGDNQIFFYTRRDDCSTLRPLPVEYCAKSFGKVPVAYKLNGSTLQYAFNKDNPASTDYIDITSSEVKIETLNFVVVGTDESSNIPRVIITIKGVVAENTKYKTEFEIRTAAVTRGN